MERAIQRTGQMCSSLQLIGEEALVQEFIGSKLQAHPASQRPPSLILPISRWRLFMFEFKTTFALQWPNADIKTTFFLKLFPPRFTFLIKVGLLLLPSGLLFAGKYV